MKNIIEAKKHQEKAPYSVPNQHSKGNGIKTEPDSSTFPTSPATAYSSPNSSSSLESPPVDLLQDATLSSTSNDNSPATNGSVTVQELVKGYEALGADNAENVDLLAKVIEENGIGPNDADDFEYNPDAFDNFEMDVSYSSF